MYRLLFFIIIFLLCSLWTVKSWSYPLQEISKQVVECKFTPWSEHDQDCKIPLPIIEGANYSTYKDNTTYRRAYSVLWWATYQWWWDVWYWWHWWVDIATAKWTPLYSIWDGYVETANFLQGWWNTVVIRHEFQDWYIRSIYAHMDSIRVNQGQKVDEGQRIWTVWNTWNSWWNHVHFQIDINTDGNNPWYYQNCNGTNAQIVDEWRCRNQLLANTIDPIEFLETQWATLQLPTTQEEKEQLAEETEERQERIDPDQIESREQIMLTELELFLARYNMDTISNISGNTLNLWQAWTIDLSVDYRNRPFNGSLPMPLEIEYDSDVIHVSPGRLIAVQDWSRSINVTAVWQWQSRVIIKVWWKIIANYSIRVVDDSTVLNANRWIIYNLGTNYIWSDNDWLILMQDENNSNIVSVPYEWTFTLQSNENLKICNPGITSRRDVSKLNNFDCWPTKRKDSIKFNYNDTLEWLFIFTIAPVDTWQARLELFQWDSRIGTSRNKNISIPTDITHTTPNREHIINWLKKWYFTNYRQSNFAPNFTIRKSDAINWVSRTFPIADKPDSWRFEQLTRLEFMKLLNQMLWLEARDTEGPYWDVQSEDRKYTNILVDYWIQLDDSSDRYFQPDKNITRWQVAKILNRLRR